MDEITRILPEKLFVTGTDTGVGKTLVCAVLMSGSDVVHYWKPIQTGKEEGTDTEWIRNVTGLPKDYFFPEAYCFEKPLSPHAAAALENATIDVSSLKLPKINGRLLVEGAGGILVPVNGAQYMLDVIKHLSLPVLVVARSTLGTINHTLLTLKVLRCAGIDVVGIILNGPSNESNKSAIEHYGKIRVIGCVKPLACITAKNLQLVWNEMYLPDTI